MSIENIEALTEALNRLSIASQIQNSVQVQNLVTAVYSIEQSIKSVSEHMGALKDQAAGIKTEAKGTADEMKKALDAAGGIGDEMSSVADKAKVVGAVLGAGGKSLATGGEALAKGAKEAKAAFADLDTKANGLVRAWQTAKGLAGAVFNQQNAATGARAFRELSQDPTSVMRNVLNATGPILGPILNTLMDRVAERSENQARGQRAVMAFNDRGLAGRGDFATEVTRRGSQISAETQRLKNAFYIERPEDVTRAIESVAEAGVSYKETFESAGVTMKGFGSSVWQVTLGLDKALGVGVGSSARFLGELTKASNEGVATLTKDLVELGKAAGSTSLGYSGFVGVVTQASSALSLQGTRAKDLAGAYFAMRKATRETLGVSETKGPSARVDEVAKSAFGGLIQGLSNISAPLRATIALQVAQARGLKVADNEKGFTDADKSIIASGGPGGLSSGGMLRLVQLMETGFQVGFEATSKGTPSQQAATLKAMLDFARAQNPQMGAAGTVEVIKQVLGFSNPMTAEILNKVVQKGGNGTLDIKELEKAIKEGNKLQENANKAGPLSIGIFETKIEQVKQLMRSVSDLMLAVMKGILRVVGGGLEALVRIALEPKNTGNIAATYMKLLDTSGAEVVTALKDVTAKSKNLGVSLIPSDGSLFLGKLATGSNLGERSNPNAGLATQPELSNYATTLSEGPKIAIDQTTMSPVEQGGLGRVLQDADTALARIKALPNTLKDDQRRTAITAIVNAVADAFKAAARDTRDAAFQEMLSSINVTVNNTSAASMTPGITPSR